MQKMGLVAGWTTLQQGFCSPQSYFALAISTDFRI